MAEPKIKLKSADISKSREELESSVGPQKSPPLGLPVEAGLGFSAQKGEHVQVPQQHPVNVSRVEDVSRSNSPRSSNVQLGQEAAEHILDVINRTEQTQKRVADKINDTIETLQELKPVDTSPLNSQSQLTKLTEVSKHITSRHLAVKTATTQLAEFLNQVQSGQDIEHDAKGMGQIEVEQHVQREQESTVEPSAESNYASSEDTVIYPMGSSSVRSRRSGYFQCLACKEKMWGSEACDQHLENCKKPNPRLIKLETTYGQVSSASGSGSTSGGDADYDPKLDNVEIAM